MTKANTARGLVCVAALLMAAAAPAMAEAPRPHHADYGDADVRLRAATATPPAVRAAAEGTHRPHHAD